MPPIFRLARFAAVALIGLFPICATAQVPVSPGQFDIVGLKLGITMDQAKSALETYNSSIKIISLYRLADSPNDLSNWPGVYPSIDFGTASLASAPSKIKVPVELFASVIDKSALNTTNFRGELFKLFFTPNDSGGKLYAISRVVVFPVGTPINLTTLQASLEQKYGQPSSWPTVDPTDSSAGVWLYDRRGRPLTTDRPNYGVCLSDYNGNQTVLGQSINNVTDSTFGFIPREVNGWPRPISDTERLYDLAFSGVSGASLSSDDQSAVDQTLDSLEGFVPDFQNASDSNARLRYRQCGVQLLAIANSGNPGPPAINSSFIITLSDQNASYYDNGVDSYLTQKLSAISGQGPAAASPSL